MIHDEKYTIICWKYTIFYLNVYDPWRFGFFKWIFHYTIIRAYISNEMIVYSEFWDRILSAMIVYFTCDTPFGMQSNSFDNQDFTNRWSGPKIKLNRFPQWCLFGSCSLHCALRSSPPLSTLFSDLRNPLFSQSSRETEFEMKKIAEYY